MQEKERLKRKSEQQLDLYSKIEVYLFLDINEIYGLR